MALEQNGGSWVLYNIAALYWRVVGNVGQAIECLRHAIAYSKLETGKMNLLLSAITSLIEFLYQCLLVFLSISLSISLTVCLVIGLSIDKSVYGSVCL